MQKLLASKIILLFSLFLLFVPLIYASPEEYLGEFNETGENCTIQQQSWKFVNNETKERAIAVYNCCNKTSCLTLPFDYATKETLQSHETLSFFETLSFRGYVISQGINEHLYGLPLSNSTTCSLFTIDDLKQQSENAVTEITFEKVMPNILPSNAAKYATRLYSTGKYLGLLEETNIPILMISASCVGGKYVESFVISSIKNCGLLLSSLEQSNVYEGIVDDILSCNQNAQNTLHTARKNPTILLELAENYIRNIFTERTEDISWDIYNNKLLTLSSLYSSYNKADKNITNLSNQSIERFQKKRQEAEQAFSSYNASVTQLKKELDLNISSAKWKNLFFNPNYNYDGIKEHLIELDNDTTYSFQNAILESKFNSAIYTIEEGNQRVSQISMDTKNELNKDQKLDWGVILILILIVGILIVIGYVFKIHKRIMSLLNFWIN